VRSQYEIDDLKNYYIHQSDTKASVLDTDIMADIEYSDHYAIFVTDGGVRYLTNPVSISIMDILQRSEMTSSEIALELNLSKSSIQSNMMKLSRWQLVNSYQDADDKRKVVYYPSSFKCLESVEVRPEILRAEKTIVERIVLNQKGHDSAILMLTSIIPLSVGISIDPLLERCGRLSAHYMWKKFSNMDDEQFIRAITEIYNRASFPTINVTLNGKDMTVEQTHHSQTSRESLISTRLMIGSLCQFMMERTGDPYHLDSVEEKDDTTYLIIKPYNCCCKVNKGILASEEIREDRPYAIYLVGNRSILFGNETQIRILELLKEGKRSLKQLSEQLDIPPVTVHMNIAKLMETGAISSDNDTRSKYVYYDLQAIPMLIPAKMEKGCTSLVEEMFRSLADHPSDYYRYAFKYVTCALRLTGIDGTGLMYRTGSEFAKAMVSHDLNIEPEVFLDKACGINIGYDLNTKVLSRIPLKININRNRIGDMEFRHISSFYEGLIKSGLKELTGTDYNVFFISEMKS
jgi:DNA-binding MarR family transcriptional regulator/predicted hydrocarbon binding protein